jgi:hypothetical protein
MLRAARQHPGLQFGMDGARYLGVLKGSDEVRVHLDKLPIVALRAFNSDMCSMLFHRCLLCARATVRSADRSVSRSPNESVRLLGLVHHFGVDHFAVGFGLSVAAPG